MIVTVEELDGATFEVTSAQPLVLNAEDPGSWTGDTADPGVAKFVPGGDEGDATYNPSFVAVGAGSTAATLTGPDGAPHDFTIDVP